MINWKSFTKSYPWKRVLYVLYTNSSNRSFFLPGNPKHVPLGFSDDKHPLAKISGISGRNLVAALSFLNEQGLIKSYDGSSTTHIDITPEGLNLALQFEKEIGPSFKTIGTVLGSIAAIITIIGFTLVYTSPYFDVSRNCFITGEGLNQEMICSYNFLEKDFEEIRGQLVEPKFENGYRIDTVRIDNNNDVPVRDLVWHKRESEAVDKVVVISDINRNNEYEKTANSEGEFSWNVSIPPRESKTYVVRMPPANCGFANKTFRC